MSEQLDLVGPGNFAEEAQTANLALFDRAHFPAGLDHHPALGQIFGPDACRLLFAHMRRAFSDLHIAVESLVGDNDALAFSYTFIGTQDGPLMGLPPTGNKVKIHAVFEIQSRQLRRAGSPLKPALA